MEVDTNILKASDSFTDDNIKESETELNNVGNETAKVVGNDENNSVTFTDVKSLKFSIHSILGISGEDSTPVAPHRKYFETI